MNKKLGKLMSILVLMFPLLASLMLTTEVNAAEVDQVTVNLHKRVFEKGASGENPYPKQNTGEEMPDFGGEPLNGVTFEVYDVSSKYIELLDTKTAEEATAEIVANAKASNYAPDYANKVGTQKTAGEGIATFANLPIKKDGNYATYLFVETNSPGNIKEKAAPIVLTMPIYKGNTDEINPSIHVYPKNEKEAMLEKDLTEETKQKLAVQINGETVYNVEKGVPFTYGLSALLPWNIKDKDFYRVTDTPNEGMQVLIGTVVVQGLEKDKDYTIKADSTTRGFIIEFDSTSEKVRALAGKRASISYDAILTEDAKIDTGINNEAKVELGTNVNGEPGDPEDPTEPPVVGPKVYTGGKKFKKIDDKSGKILAGAKFNLVKVNTEGKIISYATYLNGKYTWNEAKDNATSFESNASGQFEVTGLEYSEKLPTGISYAVVEYEAPSGYAILDKPVMFDVVKDQFETEVLSVKNIKKGLLPSTGGNGIYLFLVAGSILMAGAAVWYRRSKVEVEI
ncbi:SpaH/EbpB family LPXTG-anchored major pilin [Vagococcus carniphilus]|uniref:SpaH/EbpB family LPXTG-anchored major pilin n=1 Tax=Vagococcus carniphilus TaxID=218144 RepID=UPI00288F1F60|nr:SpaH/EbpB family LPXTG-anchored major pilin [Vagococcus carniphilus]MDT2831300.1 SpaH/EbpB family LPXTG-anchored major pilin [Vagococcus carniphilus]MDT2840366.1 SpaH/EbpB family LPXTG-anchored major pilin [Vagococcus carniphilus]MDT2854871.1 SpaH/EbpB family LPXTG-anchored major pilin [Vagococcus carniphilus]